MKIFLGIFIVIFTTYIGYLLSKKYTNRREYYSCFSSFNKLYLNEIKFTKLPIENLIKRTGGNLFTDRLRLSFQGKESEYDFLDKNDNDFYNNYVANLGVSDANSQELFVNNSIEFLKKCLDESIETEKKYKGLYIKLGFVLGLIIFILIL